MSLFLATISHSGTECYKQETLKVLASLTGLSPYVTFDKKRTNSVSEVVMTAPTIFCNECGASNPLQATYCFACNNPLQPVASSPLLQVQAVSTNVAVPASMVIGPLFPSYLLHSRYTIVSQIGTGGFGAVYQAKDTLFSHRLVAIKEMNQDGLSSQELAEATAAFEREALLLSDLILSHGRPMVSASLQVMQVLLMVKEVQYLSGL